MTKYHISKDGKVRVCKAKGKCPLGSDTLHFSTEAEAQEYLNERYKKEFGILAQRAKPVLYRKAETEEERVYIQERQLELKEESDWTYIERCRSSKRLPNYTPSGEKTRHYREDRQKRLDDLTKHFGEGDIVGFYEVNHLVGRRRRKSFRKQIAEVRDNGKLTIYNKETGKTITTFMSHRARVETMMIMAGDIPSKQLLTNVNENRYRAEELDLG